MLELKIVKSFEASIHIDALVKSKVPGNNFLDFINLACAAI